MCMNAHVEFATEEPDGETQVPGELGRYFDRLHALASAQIFMHMAQAMRSVDLSFSQLNALFRLYRFGPQRIAELAESAYLSPCAASRLADRLVRDGLATKRTNPESRRERLVELAPLGYECIARLRESTARAYDEILRPLPPELAGELLALLRRADPFLPLEPPD